jgi:hypothetical protein
VLVVALENMSAVELAADLVVVLAAVLVVVLAVVLVV